MGDVTLPNRPVGTDVRSISDILANFDAILNEFNGNIELENLATVLRGFLVPTATLLPYAGAAAPSGYLLCNGDAVSRVTYSELFALIGTTYGVGDGATTFNLPDLRGRVVVGEDGAAGRLSANDARGNSGGVETVALTEDQIPSEILRRSGGTVHFGYAAFDSTEFSPGQAQGIQYSGGGSSHTNLQPYQVGNYIIKT